MCLLFIWFVLENILWEPLYSHPQVYFIVFDWRLSSIKGLQEWFFVTNSYQSPILCHNSIPIHRVHSGCSCEKWETGILIPDAGMSFCIPIPPVPCNNFHSHTPCSFSFQWDALVRNGKREFSFPRHQRVFIPIRSQSRVKVFIPTHPVLSHYNGIPLFKRETEIPLPDAESPWCVNPALCSCQHIR